MLARWLRILPVLAGLAWAGHAALATSQSDGLVKAATARVAAWPDSGPPPDGAEWSSVRADLSRAAELDPGNPSAQELLGVLGARRLDRRDDREKGIAHLRASLRMRPTSPYAWAMFARASYDAGETGAEFQQALVQAARLGGNEPEVQRIVILAGLAVWDEVDPAVRQSIDVVVAAAVKRNAAETLRIAQRRGRLDVACRHVAGMSQPAASNSSQLCPTEATS